MLLIAHRSSLGVVCRESSGGLAQASRGNRSISSPRARGRSIETCDETAVRGRIVAEVPFLGISHHTRHEGEQETTEAGPRGEVHSRRAESRASPFALKERQPWVRVAPTRDRAARIIQAVTRRRNASGLPCAASIQFYGGTWNVDELLGEG